MAVCNCIFTPQVLDLLGAKRAAAMHRDLGGTYTNDDYLTNFREKEVLVFPHLPEWVADDLILEHDMFRAQQKVYGTIVNTPLYRKYAGKVDDALIFFLGYLVDPVRFPRPQQAQAHGAAVAGPARVYRWR